MATIKSSIKLTFVSMKPGATTQAARPWSLSCIHQMMDQVMECSGELDMWSLSFL